MVWNFNENFCIIKGFNINTERKFIILLLCGFSCLLFYCLNAWHVQWLFPVIIEVSSMRYKSYKWNKKNVNLNTNISKKHYKLIVNFLNSIFNPWNIWAFFLLIDDDFVFSCDLSNCSKDRQREHLPCALYDKKHRLYRCVYLLV